MDVCGERELGRHAHRARTIFTPSSFDRNKRDLLIKRGVRGVMGMLRGSEEWSEVALELELVHSNHMSAHQRWVRTTLIGVSDEYVVVACGSCVCFDSRVSVMLGVSGTAVVFKLVRDS